MRVIYVLVVAMLAVASCGATMGDGLPVLERPLSDPPITFGARVKDTRVARPGQFPYQALILANGKYVSAGSLITPTVVLTSATTVLGFQMWSITLGTNHLDGKENTSWTIRSTWAIRHPQYSVTYYYYDVAIIVLPKRAPLGSHIKPVELPSFAEVHESFTAQTALIAGWGYPPNSTTVSFRLLFSEVTVVPNEICRTLYSEGFVVDSTLCAANKNNVISNGDSGAALVIKTDEGYKQIGVASFWGIKQFGIATVPGGYTRITSVLDWIHKLAGNVVN